MPPSGDGPATTRHKIGIPPNVSSRSLRRLQSALVAIAASEPHSLGETARGQVEAFSSMLLVRGWDKDIVKLSATDNSTSPGRPRGPQTDADGRANAAADGRRGDLEALEVAITLGTAVVQQIHQIVGLLSR